MSAKVRAQAQGRRVVAARWLALRLSPTPKGVQVALLFLFFHKRLCGPLANSRFHHRPDTTHQPASKLETTCHRADKAVQHIVDLLAA
jgi:hypothetical protein